MIELRAPATDSEWATYHVIRRRVLFEARGIANYDERHPDERRANHFPFILWDADVAAGVIRVDVQRDVAIFRRVAVPEHLQRRGYGRRMIELAVAFAASRGCSRIDSHVDSGAVDFYTRCGFSLVDAVDANDSPVLMTKRIE